MMNIRNTTANRRLAKKRVLCLNEALCFVSSSVLADSFVLRNPLLRQAAGRCATYFEKMTNSIIKYYERNYRENRNFSE